MTSYNTSVINKPLKQTYSLISFPSYAGEDLYISWQYGFLLTLPQFCFKCHPERRDAPDGASRSRGISCNPKSIERYPSTQPVPSVVEGVGMTNGTFQTDSYRICGKICLDGKRKSSFKS